jgi:uncharacterized protein (UPF0276 family)
MTPRVRCPAAPTDLPAKAGIGLRFRHQRAVLAARPAIARLEVHTENYMGGGEPIATLEAIRAHYPIAMHGVGLSLGSADGLDPAHLERIRQVAERIAPAVVSEHLFWSTVAGRYLADLLPLPMTEEALDVVCRHVDQVQVCLRRPILVENPSSYLRWRHSTIPEWEFLAAVAGTTGCGILCDVNNIYVSADNYGWEPAVYLEALPPAAVGEIHLAGHSLRELENGRVRRIDDHGSRVTGGVWALMPRCWLVSARYLPSSNGIPIYRRSRSCSTKPAAPRRCSMKCSGGGAR